MENSFTKIFSTVSFQKDILGPLTIGILCFQSFGLRIFDGVIPGAIVLWTIILIGLTYESTRKIKTQQWCLMGGLVIFYFAFSLIKGVKPTYFLIFSWLSAFVVTCKYQHKRQRFVQDLSALCKGCMYYSLLHIPIMVFLNSFLIETEMPMEPKTFLGLFWFNHDEGLFGFPRIQGFAWEPSCWNLLLNLNLVFVLHYRRNIKELILSIIAIVSIMSTTGLVVMVLIFLVNWLFSLQRGNIIKTFCIGFCILALIGPFTYNQFNQKMNTGSGNTRMGDVAIAAAVIAQNPIFGADLDNIANNDVAMVARGMSWEQENDPSEAYMEQGMVNSFAALFVEWGIIIAVLILVLFYRNRLIIDRKLNILIALTVFCVIFGTPITRTGFFYMFVISSFLLPVYKDRRKMVIKLLLLLKEKKEKTQY